ncbi:MAG TPA: TIGR03557 family F420-dependent LLM class oxidoreductase [Candidatus Acidoferrales bacterium]|nr:TIGR03557 family F420-dependent LLM class oxidoreductase [Candidatus Acidoferrales bacterium]
MKIGYACEHEQYQPDLLLDFAVEADKAGFDSIWTSDHFHPWAHNNASAGFAWVWMAAAAERTKRVELGTAVTCPTLRYNPAIVAQAFATLRSLYPGRIFIGLGTGEALNEMPVGCPWPSFRERVERFEEAIQIMRMLWSKELVTFKGKYYRLRKANLYTKPTSPPPIFVAASGKTTARLAGKYADGLLTLLAPEEHYLNVVFPAMEEGAKSVGRDPRELVKAVEIAVSYDKDYDKAIEASRYWSGALLPVMLTQQIYDTREVEACGRLVGDKQIAENRLIGTTPEEHINHLEKFLKLGFQHIYIQSSSPDEIETIRMYSKHVIPYLHSTYGDTKKN